MDKPLANTGQFITLLVHANSSTLPIAQLQAINGNSLVLTGSQHESATAIADKAFNLIIVDMSLDGLSLVTLAKSPNCINCNTPIIALLNNVVDSDHKKQLIAAGFDDCLIKPLTDSKLNELFRLWRENVGLDKLFESIQTLSNQLRENKAVILTLYKKLFEELPQQINQTGFALNLRDYQVALEVTHSINSSAKICYLRYIEKSAMALENCLTQKRYDLAEDYFLMLQRSTEVLLKHRQTILDHLKT